MKIAGLIPILLLLGASGVNAEEASLEKGAKLLAPFKQGLQQALISGLANGHTEAVDACKLMAPSIAESLSIEGVVVGRSSDQLRNPLNSSPGWVVPILQRYSNNKSDIHPVTVSLESHRSGYVEPIIVKPLCMTCHGDNIEPGLSAHIARLYPDDQATGYLVGDLRGVFWIEFSK